MGVIGIMINIQEQINCRPDLWVDNLVLKSYKPAVSAKNLRPIMGGDSND